jgi:threonine dehydratase, medium form
MFPEDEVYIKTENLQVTGSFKLRGAYYKISTLTTEAKKKGVIACSAGNHAQGVALAAARQNIDALICIPEGAPISKVEATRGYGAKVELVPGVYDDAYNRAVQIAKETGRTMIHPFDDDDVIAGQGTIGLEILEQCPQVDQIIVPIGGGGLISGLAFAVKSLNPKCKIIGVQAAGAPSMYNSIRDHKIECLESVSTIADGIAVKMPGENTFSYCSKYVDEIVTVTDDEVANAILSLMEKQKLIAEGAGAVPLAAAQCGKVNLKGKKTVCLVSGGNIDVKILSRVISRGLVMQGRSVSLAFEVLDKPFQLADISRIVAQEGANVVSVKHDRETERSGITKCILRLGLETRDFKHVEQVCTALTKAGFKIIEE